jgi:hypothetical protein
MMADEEAVARTRKVGIELQIAWLRAEADEIERALQRLLRVDVTPDGGDCRQTRADERG